MRPHPTPICLNCECVYQCNCVSISAALILTDEIAGWTERTSSYQEPTCAQLANKIRLDKVTGLSAKLPDITGQWVSERYALIQLSF